MKPYQDMTVEEWQMVAPLFFARTASAFGTARPAAGEHAHRAEQHALGNSIAVHRDPRCIVNILRIRRHRRFKAWHESGVLLRVMTQLFGPAGESLYVRLMISRMRVPSELPFEAAAQTYADIAAAERIEKAPVRRAA